MHIVSHRKNRLVWGPFYPPQLYTHAPLNTCVCVHEWVGFGVCRLLTVSLKCPLKVCVVTGLQTVYSLSLPPSPSAHPLSPLSLPREPGWVELSRHWQKRGMAVSEQVRLPEGPWAEKGPACDPPVTAESDWLCFQTRELKHNALRQT